MSDWLHRTERWLRGLIPATVTVVLVFAGALPWRLPAFVEVTPAFAVMAVFYWTIYRPSGCPTWRPSASACCRTCSPGRRSG